MTNNKNSTIAQIGQSFHEFCSGACLALYEARAQDTPLHDPAPLARKCSVCSRAREIIHEVSTGNVVHLLCSNACFNTFRASKGLKTNCCDACGTYINMSSCRPEYLLHDGVQRRFCNSSCVKLYKMKNTKVLSCHWCKTLGQKFEMLSNVDAAGKIQHFCSTCCITSYKVKTSVNTVPQYPCVFCKRALREPAYFCKENKTVYAFCSPGCWIKFQSHNPDGAVHLNCQSCHDMFTWKPEVLQWQNSMYQFCSKDCCRAYKDMNGVITSCAQCKQEKVLHKKMMFSGVEKAFCSNACGGLFKQEVTRRLGTLAVDCSYCSQTCVPTVTDEQGEKKWAFCSLDCKRKYLRLHLNMSFCHLCQRQGKLHESLLWKGELRHFCNHQCLLYFCSQHNQPSPQGLSPGPMSPPTATRKSESQAPARLRSTSRPETAAVCSLALPSTSQKNKSSMCKPMVESVGTSCKPETNTQSCQTDDYLLAPPLVLPIPVPVYVPLPLQMYCQSTPITLAWPLPLPVPVLLPSTLDQIMETIKELKLNLPYEAEGEADITSEAECEADITSEAEDEGDIASEAEYEGDITAEAEDEADITSEAEDEGDITAEGEADCEADITSEAEIASEAEGEPDIASEAEDVAGDEGEDEGEADIASEAEDVAGDEGEDEGEAEDEAKDEAQGWAEGEAGPCPDPSGVSRDAEQEEGPVPTPTRPCGSDQALLTSDLLDEEGMPSDPGPADQLLTAPEGVHADADGPSDGGAAELPSDTPGESPSVLALKGSKRQAMSGLVVQDPLDSQPPGPGLDSSCGVQAWRAWVESQRSGGDRKENPVDLKEDLLSCSPTELNRGLSQFVQDVVSPRGPCFQPHSVFYLCLGIQQFLLENKRMVNIFTDQVYSSFARKLDDVLSGWVPLLNTDGDHVSRVVEEHLWECKQLGVYSPFVLLNTLMFFNTKFFHLRTVEQHLQLSFDNVVRRTKKGPAAPRLASVCYRPRTRYKKHTGRECSLGKRKREDEEELEQEENRMNPLRCPVKFFEFYLSKCPKAVLSSSTSIYLLPERTCTVNSDLWYSEMPMSRGMLGVLLNRILAVRDISGDPSGQRNTD